MAIPSISYVTAGARFLASHYNNVKDYLDYLLNPPGVMAYRTVAGSVATATWSNAIGLDLEDYDRDGMHDNTTSNSRIVFQTAGRYRITNRMTFASNATGMRAVECRLNAGGAYAGGTLMTRDTRAAVNGDTTVVECNWSRFFNVGDYIEQFAYQTSGGALSYDTGIRKCMIEAYMVGSN